MESYILLYDLTFKFILRALNKLLFAFHWFLSLFACQFFCTFRSLCVVLMDFPGIIFSKNVTGMQLWAL